MSALRRRHVTAADWLGSGPPELPLPTFTGDDEPYPQREEPPEPIALPRRPRVVRAAPPDAGNIDRLPPHDLDAERAVLGSILIDQTVIAEVMERLSPSDFYRQAHATIYSAMLRLYEKGKPADVVLLSGELNGQLEEAGGAAYLSGLVASTPSSVMAEQYAEVVARKAVMRGLIGAAGKIAAIGYEDGSDVAASIDRAEAELLAVGQRRSAGTPVASGMTLEEFVAASASGCSWLLPGCVPDQGITVFAGEPRTFKTWAALQLLLAIAAGEAFIGIAPTRSGGVLYVSEEGARSKLSERLDGLASIMRPLAGSVRIMHRLGTTLAAGDDWERVRATVAAGRPVLVVFDTLAALMVGDENSVRDMHDALRHIQRLIADFGVTVILLHHVNKNGDGRPGKRLRGSSVLWGAVDCIWTFTRDTLNELPQNAGTILVEPKDGDLERIRFTWDPETFLLGRDYPPHPTLEGIAGMAAVLEERGDRVTADALQAEFAGVGRSWFRELLASAVERGLLARLGSGRSTTYRVARRADERPDESLFGEGDE
ncbi:MAG: AAA family ATPase [Candidatus Limnocylindrales bacterium]